MKKYRAVFHLVERERARQTLNNIRNLLIDLGENGVDAELLANSEGVNALLKTGSHGDRVAKLAEKGVRFVVCANSLHSMDLDIEDFLDPVKVVSSGMGELVRRQAEGWAYIRP